MEDWRVQSVWVNDLKDEPSLVAHMGCMMIGRLHRGYHAILEIQGQIILHDRCAAGSAHKQIVSLICSPTGLGSLFQILKS